MVSAFFYHYSCLQQIFVHNLSASEPFKAMPHSINQGLSLLCIFSIEDAFFLLMTQRYFDYLTSQQHTSHKDYGCSSQLEYRKVLKSTQRSGSNHSQSLLNTIIIIKQYLGLADCMDQEKKDKEEIEMLENMLAELTGEYGNKCNGLIEQVKIRILESEKKEKQMQAEKQEYKKEVSRLQNKIQDLQKELSKANKRMEQMEQKEQKNLYQSQEWKSIEPESEQKCGQTKVVGITTASPVPVDHLYSKANQSVVYQRDGLYYSTLLSQINIVSNNNKFYLLQIIEGPAGYTLFRRWGRVGCSGQVAEELNSDISFIMNSYTRKINDKIKSGYRVIQITHQKISNEDAKKSEDQPQSQLSKPVKDLIQLICDIKMMNSNMRQIGFDPKKLPIEKITKKSIQRGYQALNKLITEVTTQKRSELLAQYSYQFYSQIPHDFGFQKVSTFILDSEPKIKRKLEMLQSLSYCLSYTKILTKAKQDNQISFVDSNYLSLQTSVQLLDKNSQTYQQILRYAINTFGATHQFYQLQVLDVYRLEKQQEDIRYKSQIPNKQLLWHGSRLTNFFGILSSGLMIPPPEAPLSGYIFGKGIYFTDSVSKSANYCYASRENNIALMLLCEVALGNSQERKAVDHYANCLPPDRQSVKGVGKMAPSSGEIIEGIWAPNGKMKEAGINDSCLLYNEYVVYDVRQIKMKFLVRVKLDYK